METLIKENGFIKYLIECDEDKASRLEFKIYNVVSWNSDNTTHEKELYLSGFIKWDGCAEIQTGENIHTCSKKSFMDMKKVLDAVWQKAENEIENFNKEIAE